MDLNEIEEIENIFIPLEDGVQLAARVFLPKKRPASGVPAILEYLPYRKRDLMRVRDEPIHRYFALQGYASLRVDIRGSGDSGGVLHDEYSTAELNDALCVLQWIASQTWCSGDVGMMGISWGGFNSLQVAALNPPELKAIISLCASDDRYSDDAHYMGGCLLNENMQWGSILTMYAAYPPDPEIVGEKWRDMWAERIDNLKPFAARWMNHPWRDEFWQHGSICEEYDQIKTPTYLVGGWADGYSNSVLRTFRNLKCPKKALIGPWAHNFPHDGVPGPSIGFLQEACLWWERWLKQADNGIEKEPPIRVWMQDSVEPAPQYEVWPGRWVVESDWPSQAPAACSYYLGVGALDLAPEDQQVLSFSSPLTVGARAGEWCAFGADGEMPRDQRPDDGGSLVFDSSPLSEKCEILGTPEVRLSLSCSAASGMVVARLCDVSPTGSSLRVSYGLLNLTHRDSHETPSPLEPEESYDIVIRLNDIAHCFPAGHRIRLAISNVYWPIAWPSPVENILSIKTGVSRLDLPVRSNRPELAIRDFEPPEAAPSSIQKKLLHLPMHRKIDVDLTTNEMVYTLRSDGGELEGAERARIEDIDLDLGYRLQKRYRIIENDPCSAQTDLHQRAEFKRGNWKIRITSHATLTSTEKNFQFSCDLETYENEVPFKRCSWTKTIPRKLV